VNDEVVQDEPVADIIEQEEEDMDETETRAIKMKRKLFSTNVSYLDPETEEEEDVFKVTPVKKRRTMCDIMEIEDDDEVLAVIQSDELDTVVTSSQEASVDLKVELNDAFNKDNDCLEQNDNLITTTNDTYTVSQPAIVTSDYNQAKGVSFAAAATEHNVPTNKPQIETLDDIFDVDLRVLVCD